ncbi:periplasmic heavy metal sensor [Hymenobacter properus]|uniref:Periplasmic heavy metal sensor n=1 Tax=Hymenobacter properus TaxID=2791026 RepID=A0A931FP85_9BACT|nr:periplasmic heavy metal sensor [Hymenobacter properus]MBF9143369.1 periplasmic heavy metal sensor [Hymenobacter properus]MBR7722180.1 periplasmic heavy metal sensor [Microvirga sp. SRT04]
MKKSLLLLLAASALTLGSAAAQTTSGDAGGMRGGGYGRMQGSPDEMAKRQANRLTQELGLNADQTAKVQQILLARGQEMQAMRGQAGGDRDKMREQMQASRTKYDAQFKEVLTADQYTKYTSMETERMNRGGRGMGGPGMGGPDSGRPVDGESIEKMKAKTDDGEKLKVKGDKVKAKADKVKVKTDN